MKVVLLANVPSLGRKFEVKNVASGHARNFLLPHGLATLADRATLKRVESLKRQYETSEMGKRAEADRLIGELEAVTITIQAKANEQGHLFEGVSKEMIATEIKKETKIELDPEWLDLDRPIKALGEYEINLATGKIKIQVTPIEPAR